MANPTFATDFDGGPATDALGQNRLLALIAALTQTTAAALSGGAGAARTSTFNSLGASGSVNIPTAAKAWTVSFLTGTGTIGGKAVPAGFSDSSAFPPAVTIAVTTDSASSAYVRWET